MASDPIFSCSCFFRKFGKSSSLRQIEIALKMIEQVSNTGGMFSAMLLGTIFTLVPALKMVWTSRRPFPPYPPSASILSFLFMYTAWIGYTRMGQSVASRPRTGFAQHFVNTVMFILVVLPALWRTNDVVFHPIDLLIYEARREHGHYVAHHTESHNLEEAVAQYHQRYSQPPPPGFDKWYEYAQSQNSSIIDNYDQIHDDLLPFWGLTPAYIREQTQESLANPWNEVCGISIRNGVATIMPNELPTHAWMLQGIIDMMEPFLQHLPDMDLAFNMNDEARVAIPYDQIQKLKELGSREQQQQSHGQARLLHFSSDRESTWKALPEEPSRESRFVDRSFRQTYYEFGSVGCPPDSLARRMQINSRSPSCLECFRPHSIGQFVSNWSYAADICHQPDLAQLHGFYLSPSAFKGVNSLLPVFSQSKPHGFNDILYPSAWNYIDKVGYNPTGPEAVEPEQAHPDPSFSEKDSSLFWRGTTTEGLSEGGNRATWRGMTRQRLVHMINNSTDSAHDSVAVFLPANKKANKARYHVIPGDEVESTLGLQTDIRFVSPITRCGGRDCTDQSLEFGLSETALPSESIDFQSHWMHRYLFDADGAGFSGRFLPFLHSRSLIFKTALFREWYSDRLTAWHHFVPIDLRLHGLWSVLAYFEGTGSSEAITSKMRRRGIYPMKNHLKEAERIAEEGRSWAAKVLRKEDMEIYLFRLLLEWGRLTDERRGEGLGYSIP